MNRPKKGDFRELRCGYEKSLYFRRADKDYTLFTQHICDQKKCAFLGGSLCHISMFHGLS
jgi:hypothetical protein